VTKIETDLIAEANLRNIERRRRAEKLITKNSSAAGTREPSFQARVKTELPPTPPPIATVGAELLACPALQKLAEPETDADDEHDEET
jgi:hypothetical protein